VLVLDALAAQQAELSALLSPLSGPDWDRASRCDGWTIADVVLHLAQTNEMAIGSVEGRYREVVDELAHGSRGMGVSVDAGADLMVANERGLGPEVIRARWQVGADRLQALLAGCDPHTRVDWVVGQLSARTLTTTRLAEAWIHTGDVAEPLGAVQAADDRLWHIARLAWRTLPYAFAQDGRELEGDVAFELRAPDGGTWAFRPDAAPATVVRGDALSLCRVAARRLDPSESGLTADGPDGDAVLRLVRTYA
jgi:uncharacterized protein (TIGR03084 family)